MASTIKVDNVQNQPGTNVVNKCGTTVNIGAASDNIRSAGNNLQASDGGNLISQSGTTVTLGASGDTVTLASGASQSGFGRAGSVDWQTGSIKTGTFTAVTGEGYFVNTSGGISTVNLPAGVAGSIVAVADYTRTFNSNNCTVAPNGAEKIGGVAASATLDVKGQSATFVYVDGTEGWINVQETETSQTGTPPFVTACVSGACNTQVTCGNYKTAIFKGPGTFTVNNLATCAANDVSDYLVVAGGGGGGSVISGGGGAGGFRMSNDLCVPAPTTSPLACGTGITLTVTGYPITVGAGGNPGTANGSNSIFSTRTSTGGGTSNIPGAADQAGQPGGSGGGGSWTDTPSATAGGTGNTPPTSPSQGSNGGPNKGIGAPPGTNSSGGGGGAAAAGGAGTGPTSGNGGIGSYIGDTWIGPTAPSYGEPGPVINTRYFAGGGGGSARGACAHTAGTGGIGGGGNGGHYGPPSASEAGAVNTGGGGGGNGSGAGLGGSGVVMIRYKYQ